MSDYLSIHSCKPGYEADSIEIINDDTLSIITLSGSGSVCVSDSDELRLLEMLLQRKDKRLVQVFTQAQIDRARAEAKELMAEIFYYDPPDQPEREAP